MNPSKLTHRDAAYLFDYLIQHLYDSDQPEKAERFLTDFRYLATKLSRRDPLSLVGDYDFSERPGIRRIGRTLDLCGHILQTYPEQLWEQLYNRLWKETSAAIRRLLARPVRRPWLKSLSAGFVKADTALVRTVVCDGEPIAGVICWDETTLVAGTEGGMVCVFDMATGGLRCRFRAHATDIESLRKSPSGIVTAAHDGSVGVWRLENGQCLFSRKVHDSPISRSVVSPTGRYLVTCGLEGGCNLIDLRDFTRTAIDPKQKGRFTAAAVSGDDLLALARSDRTVSLYSLPEGGFTGITKRLQAPACCLAFQDGPGKLVAGDKKGNVYGLTIDDGTAPERLYRQGDGICLLTVHEPTATLYSASEEGEILRWDLANREKIDSLFRHYGPVTGLCFSDRDARFFSCGWDRSVRIWDVNGGDPIGSFRGHSDEISTMDRDETSGLIASGSWDGSVRIWDPQKNVSSHAADHHDEISRIRFNQDSRLLVTASNDGLLKVHEAATLKTLSILEGHTHWVTHFDFFGDHRLLSASDDHTIRLWEVNGGRCVKTLSGHEDDVIAVEAVPAMPGKAVSCSTDGSMILWDVDEGRIVKRFSEHEGGIWDLCVHPDQPLAATASDDKTLKIWDLRRSASRRTLSGHEMAVAAIAMCPRTMRIVSGDDHGRIIIWELESGAPFMKLNGHEKNIHQLLVTSDEKFCIASADDGHISAWTLEDGRCIRRFPVHREPGLIDRIQLTAHDRRLISCTDSGWIHVWDWRNGTAVCAIHTDVGVGDIDGTKNGRLIAAGDASGRIHLFSLEEEIS